MRKMDLSVGATLAVKKHLSNARRLCRDAFIKIFSAENAQSNAEGIQKISSTQAHAHAACHGEQLAALGYVAGLAGDVG